MWSYVVAVDIYLDAGAVDHFVQVAYDFLDGFVEVALGVLVLHVAHW